MQTFGTNVLVWFRDNHITQKRVAKELSITRVALNRKLNGTVPFTIVEVGILHSYFKIPIQLFFDDVKPLIKHHKRG